MKTVECDADGVCRLPPSSADDAGLPDVEQPSKPPGDILPLLFEDGTTTPILEDDTGLRQGAAALAGKIVGLYFSAGWCPPCRKFSPELASFQSKHADDFTVCFVSSDHSEAEMRRFMAGKGFLAVPFHSEARRRLQARLGVSMLPTLVILDGRSGEVLTDWGRSAVMRNPEGCVNAWKAGGHGCSWVQLVTGGRCTLQ